MADIYYPENKRWKRNGNCKGSSAFKREMDPARKSPFQSAVHQLEEIYTYGDESAIAAIEDNLRIQIRGIGADREVGRMRSENKKIEQQLQQLKRYFGERRLKIDSLK